MLFEITHNNSLIVLFILGTLVAIWLAISYFSKRVLLFFRPEFDIANDLARNKKSSGMFRNMIVISALIFSPFLLIATSLGIVSWLIGAALTITPVSIFDVLIVGFCLYLIALSILFKGFVQSLLSSVAILLKPPFCVGDNIKVGRFKGCVTSIDFQSISIKTADAKMVIIPSVLIQRTPVIIHSAFEQQRSEFECLIDIDDDIDRVKRNIKKAIAKVHGVEAEPGVQTNVLGISNLNVSIQVWWWTDNQVADAAVVRSDVIQCIKEALGHNPRKSTECNTQSSDTSQAVISQESRCFTRSNESSKPGLDAKQLNKNKSSAGSSQNVASINRNEHHKNTPQ